MRLDTPLIQLKSGDWIDPVVVKVITAGRNARPYLANNKKYDAYVRIETYQSSIMVPCEDWQGAVKFRDTVAEIVNARRSKKVEKATATNINGREIALVDGKLPDDEAARVNPGNRAST